MPRVVPFTGGEKESLHEALDRHRDVVLWKLEGLDDEQLRRSMTPTGTNLLGLVKHLASVEFGWFCGSFGRPSEALPFDEADPAADLRVAPDETTADVVAYYERARAAADQAVDEIDLDELGTTGAARRYRCAGCSSTCSRRRPGTSATWTSSGSSSTAPPVSCHPTDHRSANSGANGRVPAALHTRVAWGVRAMRSMASTRSCRVAAGRRSSTKGMAAAMAPTLGT